MNDIVEVLEQSGDLTDYDPHKGLETIAVAEAAERLFANAKRYDELYKAVRTKLIEQRRYVLWRETARPHGGRQYRTVSTEGSILPPTDLGEQKARRWRAKLKELAVFQRTLADNQLRCLRICEQEKIGTVRGTEGTGEFELFTPAEYLELVRAVLGEIDLDPASNEAAQATVRAKAFYTAKDDGLARDWRGRVFLNPPYHRELLPLFVDKLVGEYGGGRVAEAVMLTNNATDTEWFYVAQGCAAAICFTRGRINFARPGGEIVFPTQGQATFFFGKNADRFLEVFDAAGWLARPESPP